MCPRDLAGDDTGMVGSHHPGAYDPDPDAHSDPFLPDLWLAAFALLPQAPGLRIDDFFGHFGADWS